MIVIKIFKRAVGVFVMLFGIWLIAFLLFTPVYLIKGIDKANEFMANIVIKFHNYIGSWMD